MKTLGLAILVFYGLAFLVSAAVFAAGWWYAGQEEATGHRAGAPSSGPTDQRAANPHGAAPTTIITPCPDCGHPEALQDGDTLVCLHLRCGSIWQAPAKERARW